MRRPAENLSEETGYRAKKWEKLAEFYPSPGFLAEKMTIFLATGLTAGTAKPMEDERIEARWFTSARSRRVDRYKKDPRRENHDRIF